MLLLLFPTFAPLVHSLIPTLFLPFFCSPPQFQFGQALKPESASPVQDAIMEKIKHAYVLQYKVAITFSYELSAACYESEGVIIIVTSQVYV